MTWLERRHAPHRLFPFVSIAAGLTGAALVVLALRSLSTYGAEFDYPAAPPRPPSASVIASAEGSDDDDPMRGREVVLDIGTMPEEHLVDFYRERYPASDGWSAGSPEIDSGGGHLLCLVSTAEDDYDEYLEIYPHPRRGQKTGGDGRYLVSVSRLSSFEPRRSDRCGLAGIWFPSSL